MLFDALCSAIRNNLDIASDNSGFEEVVEMDFDDNSNFFRIESFDLENDGWVLFAKSQALIILTLVKIGRENKMISPLSFLLADTLHVTTYYHNNGFARKVEYRKDGQLHRPNGPAVEEYNEKGKIVRQFYYLNGIEVKSSEIQG